MEGDIAPHLSEKKKYLQPQLTNGYWSSMDGKKDKKKEKQYKEKYRF